MEQSKLEIALAKTIPPNKIRESLLDNDFMSDVTFILGTEEVPLKAHKIFLATSSPILYRLLKDNNEEQLNIKIQQISKPIMYELCRYAYTEEIKLSVENMFDVLFAATKFEMRFLSEKTIDYICRHISDQTVFQTLEANQRYKDLRINMKCFEYIEKNHSKCFSNRDFSKVSDEILRTIITTCKIPKQSLENAAKAWTKANSAVDLDELVGLISLKEDCNVISSELNSDNGVQNPSKTDNKRDDRRDRSRQRRGANFRNVKNFPFPTMNQLIQNPGAKSLVICGNITRKNFKYSNLDIATSTRNVCLDSVQFIYDLKTTDNEFEISVFQVDDDQRRRNLFNDRVMIGICSSFKLYKFPQKVEIPSCQKIWIRVEFPKQEFRQTFECFNASSLSTGNDIQLRRDSSVNSYAQIISALFYSNVGQ